MKDPGQARQAAKLDEAPGSKRCTGRFVGVIISITVIGPAPAIGLAVGFGAGFFLWYESWRSIAAIHDHHDVTPPSASSAAVSTRCAHTSRAPRPPAGSDRRDDVGRSSGAFTHPR